MTPTNEVQIAAQQHAQSQPPQSQHAQFQPAQFQPAESQLPAQAPARAVRSPPEVGGRQGGLEPTRYGDWELRGRCIDF